MLIFLHHLLRSCVSARLAAGVQMVGSPGGSQAYLATTWTVTNEMEVEKHLNHSLLQRAARYRTEAKHENRIGGLLRITRTNSSTWPGSFTRER
jgi:hypothetical protein